MFYIYLLFYQFIILKYVQKLSTFFEFLWSKINIFNRFTTNKCWFSDEHLFSSLLIRDLTQLSLTINIFFVHFLWCFGSFMRFSPMAFIVFKLERVMAFYISFTLRVFITQHKSIELMCFLLLLSAFLAATIFGWVKPLLGRHY